MTKMDPYAELIAGVLTIQQALVVHLEQEGVLPRGKFREILEAHISGAQEPAGRMLVPLVQMVKHLHQAEQRS